MIICLLTEFPPEHFQWRMAWNDKRQLKNNVLVRHIMMSPETLRIYPENHGYWTWLKRADFVFVCVSRAHFEEDWEWFKLPVFGRKFMKPDAKMAVCFDQDFVWLLHDKKWSWWDDYDKNPMFKKIYGMKPEEFFTETGVLEVADVYFSVLENPPYKKYTTKPVIYFPIPHLACQSLAYTHVHSIPKMLNCCSYENSRNGFIATLNHSSQSTSIEHTLRNVIRKINKPIAIFNTLMYRKPYRGKLWTAKRGLPAGSISWGRLNINEYRKTLPKCYIAIDDAEGYVGWSRFAMECAMAYIPCIGSNHACKIFFPELHTKHKDYKRQIELIRKLYEDPNFHKEVALKAYKKVFEHLDTDRLCKKLLEVAKKVGSPNTRENIEESLFLDLLMHLLMSGKTIPPRPSETGTIFDNITMQSINRGQWDGLYGQYNKFISDERVYRGLIVRAQKLLKSGVKVIRKL